MAKSNKTPYVSKGRHSNVSKATLAGVRADRTSVEKHENIMKAYNAGLNPWVTIDNPDPTITNRRKIKVKANSLWGSPKERVAYSVYGNEDKKKKKKTA